MQLGPGSASDVLVFGYGSLVNRASVASSLGRDLEASELVPAELVGHRRVWNAATDNAVPLPGYKLYVDELGERADVAVAFVGLVVDESGWLNGALLRLSEAERLVLDARERNYRAVEVSEHVRVADGRTPALPVVTYLPTPEALARCSRARAAGRLRVSRLYEQAIRDGFALLGAGELERYEQTTAAPDAPLAELRRVELPASSEP